MSLNDAARTINATAYSYISSWALLTAAELRVFDRLPARSIDLSEVFPDADLVDTWMLTLADAGLVFDDNGMWTQTDEMTTLLTGDNSYADYLGGQIMKQMTPRMTLGHTGENVLASVLANPASRRGYQGWFEDADEAHAYQSSQYAGSLGPAKALAGSVPTPTGRVLDLGGGWGAMAQAMAKRHNVDVDVVDFETVISSAPAGNERVNFLAGDALDPTTWPDDEYDGVILSYLFSSIPGAQQQPLLSALAERGVRWIAIHDFMAGTGRWASAWSLQHAVFVPQHRSRSTSEVSALLDAAGFDTLTSAPLIDEMTALVVGERR